MTMTTIALIDNHPIIRTGLGLLIKNNFEKVSIIEAENMDMLANLFPVQVPDLIILGTSQNSGANSLKLVMQTKNAYPASKLIMYDEAGATGQQQAASFPLPYDNGGSLTGSAVILGYLRAGANGYLTKQNELSDLVDCVRDVLKGKRYICSEAFDVLLDKQVAEKSSFQKVSDLLTSREYEIARYLSNGMKTSMIAQKLDRKASTISTTKTNIFKKLEVDNILKLRQVMVPDQASLHM
jgi:DNA-binding NarL/FixJ family response regulator